MATDAAAQWAAEAMAIRPAQAGDYAMGKRPASTRSTASRSTVLRLRLAASRMAMGDAVDITQRAGGVLMHEGDGTLREEVLLCADELEPIGDVLRDVVGAMSVVLTKRGYLAVIAVDRQISAPAALSVKLRSA